MLAELLTPDLALGVCAAILGGLIFGFAGFGAALIMTPTFTLLWGPPVAVATCLVMLVLSNVQVVPGALKNCNWREMAVMAAAACVTVPLGSYLLLVVDREIMQRVIGGLVVGVVLVLAWGWRYRGARRSWATAGVGATSGVLNGAAGMGGPPVIVYLLSGPDSAARNRANLIIYYSVINTVSLISLSFTGLVTWGILLRAALLTPLYAVAILIGVRYFRRSSDVFYRRFAYVALFLIGTATLVV